MAKEINTTEAAKLLGVNQSRIRQLILSNALPARKVGRDWLIKPSDLAKLKRREK